jgi:uncharacterized protein YqeY
MSLNDRLAEDQRAAMKSGDQTLTSVLRLLRSRVKEAAVAKREDLSDEEIFKIIMTEMKRRREAIELFEKGGRADLAGREKQESEILESYLPPKLSDDELIAHAQEAIKEVGAFDARDAGKVMKALMPKVTGRAEGSQVSKIVKTLLAEKKD